ncbi:MAG: ribonuclease Y [Patescibacteria group bacterium]|jgi:ribonuclease Y
MSAVIIAALSGVAGLVIGIIVIRTLTARQLEQYKNKAQKTADELENKHKDIIFQAKDEALKIKDDAKKEEEHRLKEVKELEQNVRRREEAIETRVLEIDKERKLVQQSTAEVSEMKDKLREIRTQQEQSLERISKLTKDDAKKVLLELVEKENRDELVQRIKQVEQAAKDEAESRARKIVATTISRISSDMTAEQTVSAITIPNEEMKGRIIGKEGRNIQVFEKETGVDVIIDDTPDSVILSSFDPVRRQIARVALEKLIQDGRIHPTRIEELVKKATDEVGEEVKKAGEDAAYEAGVSGLPVELLKIFGRLKFRTSYGQNMLRHAIEVSHIAGVLAAEIGANVDISKKAALLHDIGKTVSQEVSGSHALISGDIMRKYGIPEDVVHAAEAHHEDVEIKSTEAFVVQAADAISGARPGARRESLDQYIKRLTELENIANSFKGVEKSFAIQAGREVRIIVNPSDIDDLAMHKLAKDVANKVSATMQFPGQIKVNVIREMRSVEYAK